VGLYLYNYGFDCCYVSCGQEAGYDIKMFELFKHTAFLYQAGAHILRYCHKNMCTCHVITENPFVLWRLSSPIFWAWWIQND